MAADQQQHQLFTKASQAIPFIEGCLETWDQGGKEQVHSALQSGLKSVQVSSQSYRSSLLILLNVLLSAHTLRPRLRPATFSSFFQGLSNEGQVGKEAQASTSRESSVSFNIQDLQSTSLSSILLDAIWSVDLEIDSRKDIAISSESTFLESNNDSSSTASVDEQVRAARIRLADVVRELLANDVLSRSAVFQRLEIPLLAHIGLIENEVSFQKRLIRLNTTTLYRQQKFNLLREENEGYSGLINELVSGMGPSIRAVRENSNHDRIVEQESTEERNSRARIVMKNISALIGYFDLDPNRVLDVFLDVFSSNVVRHWPFFLALLGVSPWSKRSDWKSSSNKDMEIDAPSSSQFGLASLDMANDRGHNVIAHLLGFKFGLYQQQDVLEKVPDELYLMTALLIQSGHARFVDVFNQLSPNEVGMASLHEKYKRSMSDKVMSAKGNALSMAAPLTEEESGIDGIDGKGKGEAAGGSTSDVPKDPPNQVLGLLKALLSLGHLKGSLFILGRYPWLCGAYPQIADLYCRLLNVIIEPVYSTISVATRASAATTSDLCTTRRRFDSKKQEIVQISPPILRITAEAPEPLSTLVSKFVYFYGSWKTNLPLCESKVQFIKEMIPLMRILGPHGYRNPALFQKMCRVVKHGLKDCSSEDPEYICWLEVIRNILLPCLTMTSGNSGLVSEMWVILRQLSYTTRYSIYGEWKYTLYRRPELRARQAETEKEAKGILKRISSDNVKMSGRLLAKSSHTNPTVFFTVALNQIQSYSNLIAPIVESAKYLTHFEYDVFGFNLIDALSNPEKQRTKQDGTSVSMWLQSLAEFTGTLYKRYAMMDCSPVLQYIANQLKENNSKDLVIIRELILKMAGIEPLANLSDAQIAALAGGRLLRMEAMMIADANIVTPARVQLRKSGSRLLSALMDSRMAIPMLILIAQQRQACIHLVDTSEAHLKYLGNLFDTCQEILFQYIEFLHNEMEAQTYSDLMPTIKDLCTRFEMEPSIAFHIGRPRLQLKLTNLAAKENEERLRREVLASKLKKDTISQDDVKMENAEDSKGEQEARGAVKEVKTEDAEDVDMQSVEVRADIETVPIWKEGVQEAIDAADAILQEETKNTIGIYFYATFWQMGLSDIVVPTERYEQEAKSLQKIIDANAEGGRKSIPKIRIQAQEMLLQLKSELGEQNLTFELTKKRIEAEKDHWFTSSLRSEIVYQMMQHCIIPRALLSPIDAIFAAKFLLLMHSTGTRNYSSLTAYDKIIMEQVAPLIFSCTENEIRNYARFLQVILEDMNSWLKDEAKYISEAHGDNLPGFQMKWADRHGGETIPKVDLLNYEKFRQVVNKWHGMLRTMFRECLCSKEYMRIRNTIVIMTRIAHQFPLWEAHGNELSEAINAMTKDEERGDLKILGQGLMATLRKQQKTWIGVKKKTIVIEGPTKDGNGMPMMLKEPAESTESNQTPTTSQSDFKTGSKEEAKESIGEAGISKEMSSTASSVSTGAAKVNESNAQMQLMSKTESSTHQIKAEISEKESSQEAIIAARRAALESRQSGNYTNAGMNPPKNVASTASAQASRDRQANSQHRETMSLPNTPAPTSSSTRFRDREMEAQSSPQSSTKSREVSPGASSSSIKGNLVDDRRGSRVGSRVTSRAGSEEANARGNRSERDAATNRSDKDRDREKDKSRDRPLSGRRERDSRDVRAVRNEQFREKERDYERSRESDRSRRDDRVVKNSSEREQREDAEDRSRTTLRRDGGASSQNQNNDGNERSLPTGPRASMIGNGRRASDHRSDRKGANSSHSHILQEAEACSTHNRADRGGRELILSAISSSKPSAKEEEEESSNQSPASAAKKRTLADRLSANDEKDKAGTVTASSTERDLGRSGDEPNKRPRISQVRGDTDSNWSGRKRDDQGRSPTSASNVPQDSMNGNSNQTEGKGISIHGQGRPSHLPPYPRRDSGQISNQNSRSSTPYNNSSASRSRDESYQHRRQNENNSHIHSQGPSRGSDRNQSDGERDQRRKERRSGQR